MQAIGLLVNFVYGPNVFVFGLVDYAFVAKDEVPNRFILPKLVIESLFFAEDVELVLSILKTPRNLLLHIQHTRLRFLSIHLRQPIDLSVVLAQAFELGVLCRHSVTKDIALILI